MHGLMDENVHFVHTAAAINALIKSGKPYDLQVFPYERHGVRSAPALMHCEKAMLMYFVRHL